MKNPNTVCKKQAMSRVIKSPNRERPLVQADIGSRKTNSQEKASDDAKNSEDKNAGQEQKVDVNDRRNGRNLQKQHVRKGSLNSALGQKGSANQISNVHANINNVWRRLVSESSPELGEMEVTRNQSRIKLKKNLANKIFGYLARCEFCLKLRW